MYVAKEGVDDLRVGRKLGKNGSSPSVVVSVAAHCGVVHERRHEK